jgi:HK97 gp10 family phage protein
MATSLSIKIEGGANLRKALAKLDPATNGAIFRGAVREAAPLIAANARNVQLRRGGGPVHPTQLTSRTFHLRDEIGPDYGGLPAFAEVGTDVFYGAIHEFGQGRMPPRPFMGPALEAIAPKIPAIVVKHWKKASGL